MSASVCMLHCVALCCVIDLHGGASTCFAASACMRRLRFLTSLTLVPRARAPCPAHTTCQSPLNHLPLCCRRAHLSRAVRDKTSLQELSLEGCVMVRRRVVVCGEGHLLVCGGWCLWGWRWRGACAMHVAL